MSPLKHESAFAVSSPEGEVFPESIGGSPESAIHRFCYPALKWEAYKKEGWVVIEVVILPKKRHLRWKRA
jgi:hypothetical protein